MGGIIFLVLFILGLILLVCISKLVDRNTWNKGICRRCNSPLETESSMCDSQGGSHYACSNDSCDGGVWMSWDPKIKRPKDQEQ